VPFSLQKAHPNPVHGKDAHDEDHVLPKDWVEAVMKEATANGGKVDWINCGFCVDERGAFDAIDGVRRGGPPNLVEWLGQSDNSLVIPTK
jgi:tRNA 2-thiouridine synthesizing protein D